MSKKNGISMLVKRFQKRLFARNLEGVKEGHFALIAVNEHEEKRFVVPVAYLKRASFVRLLERSSEEFGFNYEGAVEIHCRPSELQILMVKQAA